MIDDDALVDPAPAAGPLSTQTTERPPRASSSATDDADHAGADDDRVRTESPVEDALLPRLRRRRRG